MLTNRKLHLWAPLVLISLVAIYDGYLVLRTGDMIYDFEQNPVGKYLLAHGGPITFLLVKAAGTIVVLVSLTHLHKYFPRYYYPITLAVVLFMAGLLTYLEMN
jgi:hypothetical protein